MATTPRRFTADDVLDLPVPEGAIGYEFVDGEPVPIMPASRLHARLAVAVAARLEWHVQEARLPGEVWSDAGIVLHLPRDRERMRAPDVAYVRSEKIRGTDPARVFRGVPDLAIEIDLTSGKKPGGQQRIIDYLQAGVPLVWAIDPDSRTAVAYRPDGSARLVQAHEALDGEDVVPGFRLPLAELFAPPDV